MPGDSTDRHAMGSGGLQERAVPTDLILAGSAPQAASAGVRTTAASARRNTDRSLRS